MRKAAAWILAVVLLAQAAPAWAAKRPRKRMETRPMSSARAVRSAPAVSAAGPVPVIARAPAVEPPPAAAPRKKPSVEVVIHPYTGETRIHRNE